MCLSTVCTVPPRNARCRIATLPAYVALDYSRWHYILQSRVDYSPLASQQLAVRAELAEDLEQVHCVHEVVTIGVPDGAMVIMQNGYGRQMQKTDTT